MHRLTTNDPTEIIRHVQAANDGRELRALLRPNDTRRTLLVAQHAPPSAMDATFAEAVARTGAAASYGLLLNPDLEEVDRSVLTKLALGVIDHWDSPDDRAAAFIASLCACVPGLEESVIAAIRSGFEEKRWQRSHRDGSRAIQTLLTLADHLPAEEIDWHTEATGALDVAIETAMYHPEAGESVWEKAAASRQQTQNLLATDYRHNEAFRARVYEDRPNHGVIAELLGDEEDPERVREQCDALARTNSFALITALENRAARGLDLPRDVVADLLQHKNRAVREAVILAAPGDRGEPAPGGRAR